MNTEKSIQEIENNYWTDLSEYPTSLVERCHTYRKIKVKDLQIHQINTLLIQDIGSDILIPLVLKRMEQNITEEDEYDGSCFFRSMNYFNSAIWARNPQYYMRLIEIIKDNKNKIESEWGLKIYDRELYKLENKIN
ncbi:contact-dependent growth inhibition system immunity protein [Ulvibacterium sp.]|uniref:contact-dependent growth inhibition system immunity protein n=1 Tax=Ulvibacterium sp. TaxID=2665914 RepID=UPI00260C9577|nr:contact-dependent growth inhibition system immunity protein [Ulvibacterium sp.]